MSETEISERPKMSVADLVTTYLKLRERREERKRAFQDADKKDEALQDQLEGVLMKFMQDTGQDSAKTPAGTAYLAKQTSATVADKLIFREWIVKHDAWEMADVRASKKNIEEFQEANDGALPPGINYSARTVVNVRRSS